MNEKRIWASSYQLTAPSQKIKKKKKGRKYGLPATSIVIARDEVPWLPKM